MDERSVSSSALVENFRDISRINSYFGGVAVIRRLLERVLVERAKEDPGRRAPLRLLDIATGAADIPLAISRWALQRGIEIEIVATDYSEEILAIARSTVANVPAITLELADARSLPYGNGSFDIVTCSLALHHFSDEEAIKVLGEMRRVAGMAFIVNDLRRSLFGYLAARAYGLLFTRSPLTRNDGPLSVLRAFTPAELARLVESADIGRVLIERQPGWRLSLLGIQPQSNGS